MNLFLRLLTMAALAAAGLAMSACSEHRPAAPPGDMPIPSDKGYVGLSKNAAVARAGTERKSWRVVAEDGQSFPVTMDYRPERLNFTIRDGIVVDVTQG